MTGTGAGQSAGRPSGGGATPMALSTVAQRGPGSENTAPSCTWVTMTASVSVGARRSDSELKEVASTRTPKATATQSSVTATSSRLGVAEPRLMAVHRTGQSRTAQHYS